MEDNLKQVADELATNLLTVEYLETTEGETVSSISVENINGFFNKIKEIFPNDADLGEFIRNLKIEE